MKKIILAAVLFATAITTFSQSHNVTSAAIIFKQYKSEKDQEIKTLKIKEAKDFIDLAFNNESTSNSAKMWNYRAPIYLQIALKEPTLDENAILKATEAHIKCLQRDKKDRVIVRKWTEEEDILAGLVQCGYKLFNVAIEKYNAKDYSGALKYYSAIFDIIPLDSEDQLKRGNITSETILYNSFFASSKMKNNSKSKELLSKLIDINFNEPAIYIHMSNVYLEEKNTEKALEYLALGREMFEDDQSLINSEINLYIQLGRTSELIGKLGEAIELDSENDLLYFNRGTIYDQQGDFLNAEKDYKNSLEINPDAFGSNYNLGALYFNKGVATNNKANSTSNNNTHKKLKNKAEDYFTKALPYLETAHDLNSEDKNTLLSLKQLYYLNGDYKKSEEMKSLIKSIK
jgi:tetratricopeptide (TPR) repeat protein